MMRVNLITADAAQRRPCSKCERATTADERGRGWSRNTCRECIAADLHSRYVSQRTKRIADSRRNYLANTDAYKARAAARVERLGRDVVYAKARAWRLNNREKMLLDAARKRAAARGLPFDLSVEDIQIPAVCPVLGLAIGGDKIVGGAPSSPSLDRIDNALGYVRGNVAVISLRANQIKRDATAEEHERIAAWMRSQKGTQA